MTDSVNVGVGVGMYSEISMAVKATAVLIGLEKAESTISCAPRSEPSDVPEFVRAAAETMQIRLNPSTPAARTVRGPEYSRIFTLVSLHFRRITIAVSLPARKIIPVMGVKLSFTYKYSTVRIPDLAQV